MKMAALGKSSRDLSIDALLGVCTHPPRYEKKIGEEIPPRAGACVLPCLSHVTFTAQVNQPNKQKKNKNQPRKLPRLCCRPLQGTRHNR